MYEKKKNKKTTKEAISEPERHKHGTKSQETCMKRLKEDRLKGNLVSISSYTDNTRSLPPFLQITIHLLPILLQISPPADLVISMAMASMQLLCLPLMFRYFFNYKKRSAQNLKKEQVKRQQQPIKPTKRCSMC